MFMMPLYEGYWRETMAKVKFEVDTDNVDPTSPIGIGNLAGGVYCWLSVFTNSNVCQRVAFVQGQPEIQIQPPTWTCDSALAMLCIVKKCTYE